jgi:L-malate glycosyltransferase
MNKSRIFHITAHLGGGVGRVLLNYLSKVKDDHCFIHQVASLDYANDNAVKVSHEIDLLLYENMASKKQELLQLIIESDIVLIHWWNHPLLYDFLVRTELPSSRVIFWSHISGFHPPYIFTKKILTYPDLFVFTTPVSYETNEVQNLLNAERKKMRVIWSTGGVEHTKNVKLKRHKGFNIGYIGTVDYCKMHPEFLSICKQINIPEVKFIVCGGPKENEFRHEAELLGISEKFVFTGLISEVNNYLPLFDVFGYPLAPYHYGTCDQVLAESMAAGIVPVVLSNRMESYMVKDGVTGIIAKNNDGYVNAIEELYSNKKLRSYLSNNAKEYAIKIYSLEILKQDWGKVFEEVLTIPKSIRKWKFNKPIKEVSAKDVFLESLGDYGKDFVNYVNAKSNNDKKKYSEKIKKLGESPIWQAKTRGTVHHYNLFFPYDKYLSEWSNLMR